MIRGSIFTIGVLIALGTVGYGVLSIMGASMSDAPSVSDEEASSGLWTAGVGLAIGAVVCCAAWLL